MFQFQILPIIIFNFLFNFYFSFLKLKKLIKYFEKKKLKHVELLIEIHGENSLPLCTHIRHFHIIYCLNALVADSFTRGATLQCISLEGNLAVHFSCSAFLLKAILQPRFDPSQVQCFFFLGRSCVFFI